MSGEVKKVYKEEHPKYIDKIEERIMAGKTNIEIAQNLGIAPNAVGHIIESLNNPDSSLYNVNRYKKIMEKKKEILQKYQNKDYFLGTSPFLNKKRLGILKQLLAGEMDLVTAAKENQRSVLQFLLELSYSSSFYNEIQEFLKPFGFAKEENDKVVKKSFQSYPLNLQKEMILMSLTYRVSFKSMAKLFNTTILDIAKAFLQIDLKDLTKDALFLETLNEAPEVEEYAYQKAKNYLIRRNKIIMYLNQYTKNKDTEKMLAMKEKLKELNHEIDDSVITQLIQKRSQTLTQEEKDKYARFMLKYYMSLENGEKILHRDSKNLKKDMQDLALRDSTFAQKYDLYQSVFHGKYNQILDLVATQKSAKNR